MTSRRHGPRWLSVEQIVRLLVLLTDAAAKLIDALHGR
jgi:hypothetical protein